MSALPRYEDGFWHWGRWSFLLHDAGWMIMGDMVVMCECAWPTYKTLHHK